jgi:hypothetical protein
MNEHVTLLSFIAVVEFVSIIPYAGLVEDICTKFGVIEDSCHGYLVRGSTEVDLRMEHRVCQRLHHHLNRPLVDAHEEYSCIRAVAVFSPEEVHVGKVLGRQKDLDGRSGIDDN